MLIISGVLTDGSPFEANLLHINFASGILKDGTLTVSVTDEATGEVKQEERETKYANTLFQIEGKQYIADISWEQFKATRNATLAQFAQQMQSARHPQPGIALPPIDPRKLRASGQ